MKTCSRCLKIKNISNFVKNRCRGDKLGPYCRDCHNTMQRERYRKRNDKHFYRNKTEKYRSTIKGKYTQYKTSSKRKNRAFELTQIEFEAIINDNCHYCGESAAWGIDRIDNSIGYVTNNCLPCCSKCNFMKMKMEYADFITQCTRIAIKRGARWD